MMMKRILVGLGGTPFATVAIRRSVKLAKLHDAQLSSPKDRLLPERTAGRPISLAWAAVPAACCCGGSSATPRCS